MQKDKASSVNILKKLYITRRQGMGIQASGGKTLAISINDQFCLGYNGGESKNGFYSLRTMFSHYGELFAVPRGPDRARHIFLSNHINSDIGVKLSTSVDDLESITQRQLDDDGNSLGSNEVITVDFFSGLFSELKKQAEASEHSSFDKAVITLPSQLAFLNSDIRGSDEPESFSLWDEELVSCLEKAAGIAGFSKVIATGYATPLVEHWYEDADSIIDGQYIFVVEVTNSGFILSPVGHKDISERTKNKLTKEGMFIPLDVRNWFKRQLDAKQDIIKHAYYDLEDAHKEHYINQLLDLQSNNSLDKELIRQLAPELLDSLKANLREKLKIREPEPKEANKQGNEKATDEDELFYVLKDYKKYFSQFCDSKETLREKFVRYVIVTGAMAANGLLAPVFKDAFTSLFSNPDVKGAMPCDVLPYTEVVKAASKFAVNNPKFEYSPGYALFDKITITFPQSTKEQKQPISLVDAERPTLIRRLVPDVSKSGSTLKLTINCSGKEKPITGEFDFRLESWHLGSRVEAELVVEHGDRLILSTYLNGDPFEVQLPDKDDFGFSVSRLSPGVYEIFYSDDHKLHWERMTSDNTLN